MRVVVHGGMPKAGSSAVQADLAGSRDALRRVGIDYPDFGHRGHWMVVAAFKPNMANYHHVNRRTGGVGLEDEAKRIRDQVLAGAAARGGETDVLLLSHEDLSVSATAQRLDRVLSPLTRDEASLHLISYVRDPISLYPSAVQQALKSQRDRPLPPSEWVSAHIKRAQRLKGAFGQRSILRLFAPRDVDRWDVVEDFRQACGAILDRRLPPRGDSAEVNSSLSAEACAILELGRRSRINRQAGRYLPRLVRFYESTVRGTKLRIPEEWKADIAACNAAGWNEVLKLLDCSDEARARARLEDRPTGRSYSDADVSDWLMRGLDREWCERFAAFCQTVQLSDNAGIRTARWINRDVLTQATDRRRSL